MAIHLNVGNKWDLDFLEAVKKLNKTTRSDVKVVELYGDCRNGQLDTSSGVRINQRIPFLTDLAIRRFIDKAHKANLKINWTLNKSCIGTLPIQPFNIDCMQSMINRLVLLGVDRFTVYSPFILTHLNFKGAAVEISTIHNNSNINMLTSLINLNKFTDKICLPIYMNRNLRGIKNFTRNLSEKIIPEVIVNEFCISSFNVCVYRQECYNLQSHGVSTNDYPFNICTAYRKASVVNWLRSPFILPEWLYLYSALGVKSFKLTGRTHPKESIIKVIKMYMNMKSKGSLENLWGTGLPGHDLEIPSKMPIKNIIRFINYFTLSNFVCDKVICGIECNYCHKYAENNLK